MLFLDQDPFRILFKEEIYKVSLLEGEKKLTILLPFADKGELELKQSGRELVLAVKNEVSKVQSTLFDNSVLINLGRSIFQKDYVPNRTQGNLQKGTGQNSIWDVV